MADNIAITPATEGDLAQYALDDVGGVLHQRVKVEFGEDGSATDVSAVNPLPVAVSGVSTEATLSALKASIDALSAKVLACNTGSVALDDGTLAALKSINLAAASAGLTIDQIRELPLDVALDPEYQFQIDQTQTTVVGGKTKQGAVVPQAADVNGAQMLSDAPTQITGQAFSTAGLGSILCSLDTQGYQSISLHVFGVWSGTLTFYISNTGQDWQPLAGYLAASGVAPVSSTTVNGVWVFPAVGRYFKAQMTSYASGVALSAAFLRNQPMPVLESIANRNIAQLGGYSLVQPGGVSAMPPLAMGGGDATGRMRRFQADVVGNQMIVGPVPDQSSQPILVKPRESGSYGLGLEEAVQHIVTELRYHSYVLSLLPEILNSANYKVDEPEAFRSDLVIS